VGKGRSKPPLSASAFKLLLGCVPFALLAAARIAHLRPCRDFRSPRSISRQPLPSTTWPTDAVP